MKRLPTTTRECRGRNISWTRIVTREAIILRAFKRDSTGRSHMMACHLPLKYLDDATGRHHLAVNLLACRRQVRWAVDQIDFELLGLQDNTPPPATPWLGGEVPRPQRVSR